MLHTQTKNIIRGITTILAPNEIKQLKTVIAHQREVSQREYDHAPLNDYMHKRLSLLLSHSMKTVPYYQKIWYDAGLTDSALQFQEVFQHLPIIDKTQLQKQGNKKLISSISQPTILSKSSGTTGRPVFRFMDRNASVFNHLAIRRYLRDNHIPIGSTILFSHSDKRTSLSWQSVPPQFFAQRVFVSVFTLIENPKLIQKLNIDVVVGSPHQLQLLAQDVFSKSNLKPPRLFVSIAERLDTHQRRIIKASTGSTIIDVYCGSEFSTIIAFECQKCNRLHTNSDFILVEILDAYNKPVSPGCLGEVVITDLCNFVAPLIRYRTGDLAIAADATVCDCKRALPVQFKKIEGRITDQLILEGGNKVSALPLLDELRAILHTNFTLIQEDVNLFSLQLHESSKEDFKFKHIDIQELLIRYLHPNASIKVDFDHLSNRISETSGKLRSFVSRIPHQENLTI
jgi:phenylacetate-CoA ligase